MQSIRTQRSSLEIIRGVELIMGLNIYGNRSGKSLGWGSHALHWVRTLAIATSLEKVEGKTAEKIWKEAEKLEHAGSWDRFPEFWQLLHFADNEGVLICGSYLDDVDYSKSFYLGSLDRLHDNLESIKNEITLNMKPYESYLSAREVFWKLYDLVDSEQNEGGSITFS